ncbi:hypothetical protein L1F30_09570 [Simiduia sp. 21SJ11W-1]|uniref:hypothetical protein n=1 Tax=Simiduia sp. 21SJ11W-1 TaxID=2909669 RepID=UPI0020A19D0B|nr:hypothetical protein [Simiduia sp. 21SJ11W-1]UTA46422.1 hypothetical protein L1F30_09570 [Simiduia sp. 21SJ11W-1]
METRIKSFIFSPYSVFLVFLFFLWKLVDYADNENLLDKEFFDGNLLPELIGFGLEGLLFVGLLAVYNSMKEKDRIRAVHFRLSDAVGLFAKGVSFQVKDKGLLNAENLSGLCREIDGRQGFAYDAVTTTLYYLHGDIPQKGEELSLDYMKSIYLPIIDHAEFSKTRLDELLALASSISISYLDHFNLLRQELDQLISLKNGFEENYLQNSAKAFFSVQKYNKIAERFV